MHERAQSVPAARRQPATAIMDRVQRHVRLSLVDGRVVLVGFQEILLRDQHNRLAGPLTLDQAVEIFEAEPEPQRTTHLDVLRRHHEPARPVRPADI